MENKLINQKEYLKKYMSSGDSSEKKKKKKRSKTGIKTVKIIDDDLDLKNMRPIEEGEFDIRLEGEDAPQIAGIIDERGPVDFTDKKRWKIITENEEGDLTIINKEKVLQLDKIDNNEDKSDDPDLSPPTSKRSKTKHVDSSSPRRSKDKYNKNNDSDLSPPRSKHSKNKFADLNSGGKTKDSDSDLSPPRQSKNNDSDLSPPRKSRNDDNDSDLSPRQFKNYDSDLDLPRKIMKHSTRNRSEQSYRSSRNRNSDSDFSPPRKHKQQLDTDFYESRDNKKSRNSYSSTSRRKEHRSRKENSPRSSSYRTNRRNDYYDKNSSRSDDRQDVSRSSRVKPREYENYDRKSRSHSDTREKRKKSRWGEETDDFKDKYAESHSKDGHGRMTKTLDGKTAGFQAAKELREEIEAQKQRDAQLFSKLSNEISGKGKATIVRDKQTGRKRNLEEEAAKNREQQKKQQELDEKYAKWGKGLKQVEDREEKLKNDLYEMNKPLARYADDADLDKELREQDREGDPMLKYIKQKQIKEGKRKPEPLQYKGSFAPNRFGIKPGYRWDGVDRSNGYEKRWFETQNAKVAQQEEAYKWSTSDM